ncbi:hypothetical protein Acsp03_66080 [Actinomadura sp. NBRC 104412]|uniref:hypothetical protein n=1 Tax=Actinomadura sp. NBRC 104412 TaxID=3032203 RepID=UPI0024A2B6AF|nr:hypothetical protein [Actinomadura sp. NBRC 104412]GLZ09142.1 hypothetical protein Acsp03_66080 [Actinomadura sp. NBRC 104412]
MTTGPLEKDSGPPPAAHGRPLGTQAGPAWIVLPARVIAVVIVLPLRLVYDLAALAGRGLKRTPGWIGRMLRAAYLTLLHPIVRLIGMGAAALWSGVAWLWTNLVYGPLRWLAVVALWGGLRFLGRGIGRAASWFTAVFLAPIGRLLAAIVSGLAAGLRWLGTQIGKILNLVLVRPLAALCRGIGWVLKQVGLGLWLVLRGIGLGLWLVLKGIGLGLWLVLKGIGIALRFLGEVLIVRPALLLWRYVLRPPLDFLARLARATGAALVRALHLLGTGVSAVWGIFLGALFWAWRMLGRLFSWTARILFVIPALALYRYLLRPLGQAIAALWRFTARGLRWLWRTLVVTPARVVKETVLVPAGQVLRAAWRVTVRDPARWVSRSVLSPIRQTVRDVRLQFRRAFRGRPAR